jgi:hypothetical protein
MDMLVLVLGGTVVFMDPVSGEAMAMDGADMVMDMDSMEAILLMLPMS